MHECQSHSGRTIYALIFSGIYSIDNTLFDLYLVLIAGAIGYVMRRLGFPFLPLVLGLVLGYLIEANYRRSLLLKSGEHRVFVEDPISLGLLITLRYSLLYQPFEMGVTKNSDASVIATSPPKL